MENFSPNDKLNERRTVLNNLFGRRRRMDALEDACRSLRMENVMLNEELEKKEMVVQSLYSYLQDDEATPKEAAAAKAE